MEDHRIQAKRFKYAERVCCCGSNWIERENQESERERCVRGEEAVCELRSGKRGTEAREESSAPGEIQPKARSISTAGVLLGFVFRINYIYPVN